MELLSRHHNTYHGNHFLIAARARRGPVEEAFEAAAAEDRPEVGAMHGSDVGAGQGTAVGVGSPIARSSLWLTMRCFLLFGPRTNM